MKIVSHLAGVEGCAYFRIVLPGLAMRARGHEVAFTGDPEDPRIADADVFVMQRQHNDIVLDIVEGWQAKGVQFMFEFDDNMHHLSPLNPAGAEYGNGKRATRGFERFLSIADGVTTTTPALVEYYSRYRRDISMCPNGIDDEIANRPIEIDGKPKVPGQIRIGFAGSNTHLNDLLTIRDDLVTLMREYRSLRFVTIGDPRLGQQLIPRAYWSQLEFVGIAKTRPEFSQKDPDPSLMGSVRYYDLLREACFDIGVAPLEHLFFNRCKSNLRLMELGVVGVPAIAERFGEYSVWPHDSVVLCRDKEWLPAMRRLIESSDERARLAQANLAYVRANHVMSKKADAWEKAFERTANRSVAA